MTELAPRAPDTLPAREARGHQFVSKMSDRFAVLPQYLLPKRGLTVLMGLGASKEGGALTTAVIRWFIGRYGVDMN